MTADQFRTLALALPEATEGSHMDHPDFRVAGKIFATLSYPDEGWGMVKLSPEQQHEAMQLHPGSFEPAKGAWGRQGSTLVHLAAADAGTVGEALKMAWTECGKKKAHARKRAG